MTSTTGPMPYSMRPPTWGELCAALDAGQVPATISHGEYVVSLRALQRAGLGSGKSLQGPSKSAHLGYDHNQEAEHGVDFLFRQRS